MSPFVWLRLKDTPPCSPRLPSRAVGSTQAAHLSSKCIYGAHFIICICIIVILLILILVSLFLLLFISFPIIIIFFIILPSSSLAGSSSSLPLRYHRPYDYHNSLFLITPPSVAFIVGHSKQRQSRPRRQVIAFCCCPLTHTHSHKHTHAVCALQLQSNSIEFNSIVTYCIFIEA